MTQTPKTDFVLLPRDATEEKVSRLLMKIADEQGNVDKLKAQIGKLRDRKASAERRIEEIRGAIEDWMLAHEHKTLRLPEATLTMSQGKAKLMILDENKLPLDCFIEVVNRRVDKGQVKALLLTGQPVEGATMSNPRPELQIRF